jgi:hypothetical protein
VWLTKFLETISRIIPGDVFSGKEDALSSLNPDKIYVENVRSVLGVSNRRAVQICESAVRQGLFRRGIEILCPDGAVAVSVDSVSEIPKTVHCWKQQGDEIEEEELPTSALRKITFYRLNAQSASVLYRQPA